MIVLLLAIIVAACSSSTPAPVDTVAPATAVPPTAVPPTAVPPTAAPTAEPTPAGPVAVLPTPASGSPSAQALANTWILAGPSTAYPVYGAMLGGVSAQIIGVSEDSLYWVVSVPVAPQGQGWVAAAAVQANQYWERDSCSYPAHPAHRHPQPAGCDGSPGHRYTERVRAQRAW